MRRSIPAFGLALGIVVVIDAVMLVTDTGPNLGALTALGLVIGAVGWLLHDVRGHLARPRPATTGASETGPRADLRITTLRQALAYGTHDHYLTERVHASLVGVIDDELLAAHGVDRTSDPDGAREVIGPELQRFVDDPHAGTTLTAPRLERVVTLIEQMRGTGWNDSI